MAVLDQLFLDHLLWYSQRFLLVSRAKSDLVHRTGRRVVALVSGRRNRLLEEW